jgi:transposase-like protein
MLRPRVTVHAVAQQQGVNTSQLSTWRKPFRSQLGSRWPHREIPGRRHRGSSLLITAAGATLSGSDPRRSP